MNGNYNDKPLYFVKQILSLFKHLGLGGSNSGLERASKGYPRLGGSNSGLERASKGLSKVYQTNCVSVSMRLLYDDSVKISLYDIRFLLLEFLRGLVYSC